MNKELPYIAETTARVMVLAHPHLFQQAIAGMLTTADYLVIHQRPGEDLLTQIVRENPDLVILDSALPGIDTCQLCSLIKVTESTRLVPVIMVASGRETQDRVKGLEAGADDVLRRPVSRIELLARARSLVRIKRLTDELISIDRALMALATAIEAKDWHTGEPVERVVIYAMLLGQHCNLPPQELKQLRRAAMLHDVGKLSVPESILLKPGPLDAEEWGKIKAHPVLGETICRELGQPRFVLEAVRHHHERYDGQGYPDGLAGDNIPLGASILAIADAYEVMTNPRPYRGPVSQAQALNTIRGQAARQFDPRLAETFVSAIQGCLPVT